MNENLVTTLQHMAGKIRQAAEAIKQQNNSAYEAMFGVCQELQYTAHVIQGTGVEMEAEKTEEEKDLEAMTAGEFPWLDKDGNIKSMQIDYIEFWPKSLVLRAFDDVEKAWGTHNEWDALRKFYRRMCYFKEISMEISGDVEDDPCLIIKAVYERQKLEADGAGFRGKAGEV